MSSKECQSGWWQDIGVFFNGGWFSKWKENKYLCRSELWNQVFTAFAVCAILSAFSAVVTKQILLSVLLPLIVTIVFLMPNFWSLAVVTDDPLINNEDGNRYDGGDHRDYDGAYNDDNGDNGGGGGNWGSGWGTDVSSGEKASVNIWNFMFNGSGSSNYSGGGAINRGSSGASGGSMSSSGGSSGASGGSMGASGGSMSSSGGSMSSSGGSMSSSGGSSAASGGSSAASAGSSPGSIGSSAESSPGSMRTSGGSSAGSMRTSGGSNRPYDRFRHSFGGGNSNFKMAIQNLLDKKNSKAGFKNYTNEGFVNALSMKQMGLLEPVLTMPNAKNPFMNVSPEEVQYNPFRPPAADVTDPGVKQQLDNFFRVQWFSDPTDVFGKSQDQRQFITQPSTSIPNDRESYQNWLYKLPFKTCKEGNADVCVPGSAGGAIPWLQVNSY
jgi:hypothetical protein